MRSTRCGFSLCCTGDLAFLRFTESTGRDRTGTAEIYGIGMGEKAAYRHWRGQQAKVRIPITVG